jgi:hypothetical protein
MSAADLDPLDPDLANLLGAERERPGMPEAARDRLMTRLAPLALGGGAAGGGGPTQPATTSAAPAAAATATLGGRILVTIAAFVIGGLAGAGGHARLSASPGNAKSGIAPPLVVLVTPAAPSLAEEQAAAPEEAVPAIEDAPLAPAAPSGSAHLAGARDVDLAAERALLEVARTALARGDHAAALAALDRHGHKFPRGRLGEERESLYVHALAAAGRTDEARTRAQRFREKTPDSILLPSVEAAVDDKR